MLDLVGCASYTEIKRTKIDSNFESNPLKSETSPVLLAADLQVHYIYNSINSRNNFINGFSESIRPSATDYFAPANFKNKLEEFREIYPDSKILILGDVLDVSCDWEFDKFTSLMKNTPNWVLAPGNHDFIFLGTHEKKERTNEWIKACRHKEISDGRFNKVEFIFKYLETLAQQSQLSSADPSYA